MKAGGGPGGIGKGAARFIKQTLPQAAKKAGREIKYAVQDAARKIGLDKVPSKLSMAAFKLGLNFKYSKLGIAARKAVEGVKGLPDKVKAMFSKKAESGKMSAYVVIDGGKFGEFNLSDKIMPKIAGGIPHDVVVRNLSAKVQRGGQLVERIMSGEGRVPEQCSIKDMTDIMWFMQASAERKEGGSFASGAMTIEDNGYKIVEFFDTCPESYQRVSSHLKEFQEIEGGVQRGIDNNTKVVKQESDFANILPHGKGTLLYGKLMQGFQGLEKPMSYLKIELYGAYTYKPKGGTRAERDVQGGPKSRPKNRHDFGNAVGHGKEFVIVKTAQALGKVSASDFRRESLPKGIKNKFKAIEKTLPDGEIKGILMRFNPLSGSGGARVMLKNLQEAQLMAADEGALDVDTLEEFGKAVWEFKKEVRALNWDNVDTRFGNEVSFSAGELPGSAAPAA